MLHVDLDPFFVNVERSLDPSLRGQPVLVGGGDASWGFVAAASAEARQAGVLPGQSMATARRLCPSAFVRQGDLETYARFSEDVSGILLAATLVGGTFVVITMAGMQEARRVAAEHARPLMAAMTSVFALGQIAGPLWVGYRSSVAPALLAAAVVLALSAAALFRDGAKAAT